MHSENFDTLRPPADLWASWLPFLPLLQSFSCVQSSHPPSQGPPQPRVMSIRICVQRRAVHIKIDKGGSYIIGTAAQGEGKKREPRSPGRAEIFALDWCPTFRLRRQHARRKKRIPQDEGGGHTGVTTLRTCRIVVTGLRHAFWIGNLRGSCERADNDFNTYRRRRVLIR